MLLQPRHQFTYTSEKSDGIKGAYDGDHDSTVNEGWKTATLNSKEWSEYLNLEKQHGFEKEGV